jgi:XTP/dITP diphosphohydrolase
MKLVFATANKNKANEIQSLIPTTIEVLTLNDIHCSEEIPETQATIEGNASQKAFYVYNKYLYNLCKTNLQYTNQAS